MTSKYTLRPTRWSDRDSLGRLYVSAFSSANDNIIPVIFPSSSTDAVRLRSILSRIFEKRLFSPLDYVLKSLVRTSTGEVVGFSCVKPPTCSVTFYQRWLSPSTWLSFIMRGYIAVRDSLTFTPNPDSDILDGFGRVMDIVEPEFMTTQRRKDAWYISTLAVDPSIHGAGLGSLLVKDTLADAGARATWLVGLRGVETFYERFDFKTVARANVGELEAWTGGSVMMRD